MTTRCVRSETGALFEVDASMLAESEREPGYRDSCAPPRVGEIQPASLAPSGDRIVQLASLFVLALGIAALCLAAIH